MIITVVRVIVVVITTAVMITSVIVVVVVAVILIIAVLINWTFWMRAGCSTAQETRAILPYATGF